MIDVAKLRGRLDMTVPNFNYFDWLFRPIGSD
jgi:hypothetical protein